MTGIKTDLDCTLFCDRNWTQNQDIVRTEIRWH